jgi:hypothetical protein
MIMEGAILLKVECVVGYIDILQQLAEFSKYLLVSAVKDDGLLPQLPLLLELHAHFVVDIFAAPVLLFIFGVWLIDHQVTLIFIVDDRHVIKGMVGRDDFLLGLASPRVDTDIIIIIDTVCVLVDKGRFPYIVHYKGAVVLD